MQPNICAVDRTCRCLTKITPRRAQRPVPHDSTNHLPDIQACSNSSMCSGPVYACPAMRMPHHLELLRCTCVALMGPSKSYSHGDMARSPGEACRETHQVLMTP